ncbi:hypothetical protein C8Q76DRAFT_605437 [Earliella scabrosa]|nr:hypothetical protein C8Q76DRAFT_605437 [Earliella scabrosa]
MTFCTRDNDDLLAHMSRSMDLVSLLHWRATCRVAYDGVVKDLGESLRKILLPIIPCASEFLRTLTKCGGVLGGEAALSFFLRDPCFEVSQIEIFVTDHGFPILIDFFSSSPFLAQRATLESITTPSAAFISQREIARYATIYTADGGIIIINESVTMSPCSPIARSWTSALINYVSPHSFGCAYPPLTFNRRTVVSDMSLENLTNQDVWTMAEMTSYGFSFALDPSRWPEYRHPRSKFVSPGIFPCMRKRFLCPDQGRYFGDRGSLVDFFRPLSDGPTFLKERRLPPYGPMATWRLWITRVCDSGCARDDPLLDAGLISILTLIVDDPLIVSCPPPITRPTSMPAVSMRSRPLPGRRRADSV